jgi:predicted RNase H-like HicB family nuclease
MDFRINGFSLEVLVEPGKFDDARVAWHAFCPGLGGCHTCGYTHEEALANIREAIELYVDNLR